MPMSGSSPKSHQQALGQSQMDKGNKGMDGLPPQDFGQSQMGKGDKGMKGLPLQADQNGMHRLPAMFKGNKGSKSSQPAEATNLPASDQHQHVPDTSTLAGAIFQRPGPLGMCFYANHRPRGGGTFHCQIEATRIWKSRRGKPMKVCDSCWEFQHTTSENNKAEHRAMISGPPSADNLQPDGDEELIGEYNWGQWQPAAASHGGAFQHGGRSKRRRTT